MGASDFIAVIALVVALATGYATLKVDRRSVELETYHRATDLFLKLNEVFLEHPQLRPYFYEGRQLEKPASGVEAHDEQRVLMTAELMLDIFDWICHDCEGASEQDTVSWFSYIRASFDSSPVLVQYHLEHRDWHPVLDSFLFGSADGPPPCMRQVIPDVS